MKREICSVPRRMDIGIDHFLPNYKNHLRTPIIANGTLNPIMSNRILQPMYICKGHLAKTTALLTVKGGWMLTADDTGVMKLWEFENIRMEENANNMKWFKVIPKFIYNLRGLGLRHIAHKESVNCMEEISPGVIASGATDNFIKIWEYSAGVCMNTLTAHKASLTCICTSGEDLFWSGDVSGCIICWDIHTLTSLACLSLRPPDTFCINGVLDFGGDAACFGSIYGDGSITLWERGTNILLLSKPIEASWYSYARTLIHIGNNAIGVATRKDTIKLFTKDKILRSIGELVGHQNWITDMCSLTPSVLLSSAFDKCIIAWNIFTQKSIIKYKHDSIISCIARIYY